MTKIMRGLSVRQPHASLMAAGAKVIETRTWRTTYRGLVAIHASSLYPHWCRELECLPAFAAALSGVARPLPTGSVIAVAELLDCARVETMRERLLGSRELVFGDFSAGRYGWQFAYVRALRSPVPIKGKLGLWSIPPDVAIGIAHQAGL